MTLLRNRKLTITKRIPEFNRLISTSTDDLSIIGAERDGENVICMAYEATGCFACVEIPETEGFVPGGGEGVLAV